GGPPPRCILSGATTLSRLSQESLWQLGPPHSKRLAPSWRIRNWGLAINQVSVGIMFHHVASSVPPIVEYLGAKNVTSDTPDGLVSLLREPLMSEVLGVKVVNLKRRVVDVRG